MTATASEKSQTETLHGPNLVLDVENFGPIAESKNIEFKPMTVFVGPSNTGKTYLAMLMHSFLQAYNNTGFPYIFPIRFAPSVDLTDDQTREFYNLLFRAYSEMDHDDPRSSEEPTITFEWNTLPTDLQSVLADAGVNWGEWTAKHTLDFLKDNFQVERLDALDRHNANSPWHSRIRASDTDVVFQVNLNAGRSKIDTYGVPLIVFGEHLINAFATHDATRFDQDTDDIRKELARSVNRSVAEHMKQFPRSVYLPASRTGIMTTFGILAPTVISSPANVDSENETTTRINRVTRDFLGHLAGAKDHSPEKNKSYDRRARYVKNAANNLETAVIGGNIAVKTREFGIPEIALEHDELVTPIERASSMVTELAPIVLVLRDHVNSGDLLIIDEPEAHLHPEAQQQMAAALTFMVRSGLRVLITTHSHYMVEQLSNFVMASGLDGPADRKRLLGIEGQLGKEDIYLQNNEIAVYDFDPSSPSGGSIVKEVPFEDGYFPEDHIRAIGAQFNRNNRIESAVLGPE